MSRLRIFAITVLSLLTLGVALPPGPALSQSKGQQSPDLERVNAVGRAFIAAIVARDIHAMDKLWAHEPYATFIGPLSTTIVVGWEGVRRAWEMRFGQFDRVTISLAESHVRTEGKVAWAVGDRVTISLAESHVRTEGKVAWAVGVEKVELLRKSGETLSFDAFVTNVFEEREGRWLVVSHQATPMFRGAPIAPVARHSLKRGCDHIQ